MKNNKFISRLIEPFKVIGLEKKYFLVWAIFTLFAGQIGIISNLILRNNYAGQTIVQSLLQDSLNGSFYTYSIALFASALGLLFVNLIENNPTKFKSIKLLFLIVTIFTLFFAGIFYSSSALKQIDSHIISCQSFSIDLPQLLFFILSIIFAIYTFCITRLEKYYDTYKHLEDNYSDEDDKKVDDLDNKVNFVKTDNKGNKL